MGSELSGRSQECDMAAARAAPAHASRPARPTIDALRRRMSEQSSSSHSGHHVPPALGQGGALQQPGGQQAPALKTQALPGGAVPAGGVAGPGISPGTGQAPSQTFGVTPQQPAAAAPFLPGGGGMPMPYSGMPMPMPMPMGMPMPGWWGGMPSVPMGYGCQMPGMGPMADMYMASMMGMYQQQVAAMQQRQQMFLAQRAAAAAAAANSAAYQQPGGSMQAPTLSPADQAPLRPAQVQYPTAPPAAAVPPTGGLTSTAAGGVDPAALFSSPSVPVSALSLPLPAAGHTVQDDGCEHNSDDDSPLFELEAMSPQGLTDKPEPPNPGMVAGPAPPLPPPPLQESNVPAQVIAPPPPPLAGKSGGSSRAAPVKKEALAAPGAAGGGGSAMAVSSGGSGHTQRKAPAPPEAKLPPAAPPKDLGCLPDVPAPDGCVALPALVPGVAQAMVGPASGPDGTPRPVVFVSTRRAAAIVRRREQRARLEARGMLPAHTVRARKPYLHQSRHDHAQRRIRGPGGRFLSASEKAALFASGGAGGSSSAAPPASSEDDDAADEEEGRDEEPLADADTLRSRLLHGKARPRKPAGGSSSHQADRPQKSASFACGPSSARPPARRVPGRVSSVVSAPALAAGTRSGSTDCGLPSPGTTPGTTASLQARGKRAAPRSRPDSPPATTLLPDGSGLGGSAAIGRGGQQPSAQSHHRRAALFRTTSECHLLSSGHARQQGSGSGGGAAAGKGLLRRAGSELPSSADHTLMPGIPPPLPAPIDDDDSGAALAPLDIADLAVDPDGGAPPVALLGLAGSAGGGGARAGTGAGAMACSGDLGEGDEELLFVMGGDLLDLWDTAGAGPLLGQQPRSHSPREDVTMQPQGAGAAAMMAGVAAAGAPQGSQLAKRPPTPLNASAGNSSNTVALLPGLPPPVGTPADGG